MCLDLGGILYPSQLFYFFSPFSPGGAGDCTQSEMHARQVLHHSPGPPALTVFIVIHYFPLHLGPQQSPKLTIREPHQQMGLIVLTQLYTQRCVPKY